jgi:hypothetical protein
LLSQSHWEGDRPLRDQDGKPIANTNFDYLHAQRVSNFLRRQVPYFLGIFPFMTYVVCIVYHLEYQKWRLHEETNGDLVIPEWVNRYVARPFLSAVSTSPGAPLSQTKPCPCFLYAVCSTEHFFCSLRSPL